MLEPIECYHNLIRNSFRVRTYFFAPIATLLCPYYLHLDDPFVSRDIVLILIVALHHALVVLRHSASGSVKNGDKHDVRVRNNVATRGVNREAIRMSDDLNFDDGRFCSFAQKRI